MPSRTTTTVVATLLTMLIAGCEGEERPASGWSFDASQTDGAQMGGEDANPGDDVIPGDDADDSPQGLRLIEPKGTTWTRYVDGSGGVKVTRESFRDEMRVDRESELRVEGQESRVIEQTNGSWRAFGGEVGIRYVSEVDDRDVVFRQLMPRAGLRSEAVDGWFEVPEAEQGEQMRWLPGSYLAEDVDRRRRFSGRFLTDFDERPFPSNTLLEARVDIAFDRPLDAILEGEACRVTVNLTARGRWSDKEVCQTERTIKRKCRVVSKENGIEAIGLGYGTEPTVAAETWEEVEPDLPEDSRSCEAAAEVFHGFFTPLFYRVDSRPNILFTAPVGRLARRWVRHRVE